MRRETGKIYGRDAFIAHISGKLGRKEPLLHAPERLFRGVPDFYEKIRLDESGKVNLFAESWTALGGNVRVVKREEAKEAIGAYVLKVCAEFKVNRAVRWDHAQLDSLDLDDSLAGAGVEVVLWRENGESEVREAEPDTAEDSGSVKQGKGTAAGGMAGRAAELEEAADVPTANGGGTNRSRREPLLQAAEQCRMGIVWPDYAIANTGTLVLLAQGGRGRSVSLLPEILVAVFRSDQLVTRMGEVFERIKADDSQTNELPSSINFITGPSRSADIENDLTIGVHGPGNVHAIIIE